MAPRSADESAVKTRIITHMNADHAASLSLYAQYYSHLPLSHARTARVADVTTSHLLLDTSFGRVRIPFDPPMKTLAEARERLVAMNEASLRGLGFDPSGVVVGEYILPNRAWQWGLLVLCGWLFATLPFRAQLHPRSQSPIARVYDVNGLLPQLGQLAYALQPIVLPFMLVMHTGEAAWLARTRLARFQVPVGGKVWWCWVLDCFLEGVGAFKRFDSTVEALKAKGKAKDGKH